MFKNLQYIFQDKPIPQSKNQSTYIFNNLHFQAKLKQIKQKQKQQATKMQNKLNQIKSQENVPEISHGSKLILGCRKVNDFYAYNKTWKDNLNKRNSNLKQQVIKKQNDLLNQQQNYVPAKINLQNHLGPVKGWNQHFQQYIKTRASVTISQDQNLFKPCIDKKSQKIAKKNGLDKQKVQQRLLKYSQDKKMKNLLKSKQKSQEFKKTFRNIINDTFYERLYTEGEKINKKRLQSQQQYSFQPKLYKNVVYQDRVQQIRKPLYYIKTETSTSTFTQKPSIRQLSQQQFQNFIKRNEVLLKKKKEYLDMKKQLDQQNLQKCTFRPVLNQKSLSMTKMNHQIMKKQKKNEEQINQLIKISPNYKLKTPKVIISTINQKQVSGDHLQTQDSMPRRKQLKYSQNIQISRNIDDMTDEIFEKDENNITLEFQQIQKQLQQMIKISQ